MNEKLEFAARLHEAMTQADYTARPSVLGSATVDAYLQLPAQQRKVVREVILTFAKVYREGEEESVAPKV